MLKLAYLWPSRHFYEAQNTHTLPNTTLFLPPSSPFPLFIAFPHPCQCQSISTVSIKLNVKESVEKYTQKLLLVHYYNQDLHPVILVLKENLLIVYKYSSVDHFRLHFKYSFNNKSLQVFTPNIISNQTSLGFYNKRNLKGYLQLKTH